MVQTHWLMSFPSLSLAAFYEMFETLGESPSMVSQECTALASIAVLESSKHAMVCHVHNCSGT